MKILISIFITSLLYACQSPQVLDDRFEKSKNQRHWFEQLVHDRATPLTYLSPSQPVLSHFSKLPASYPATQSFPLEPMLSSGDRIRVWMPLSPLFSGVFNEANSEFNNVFEINSNGRIKLPYLDPILATGLTLEQLQLKLNSQLEKNGVFRKGMANLNVTIVEWSSISVYVSGSVFNPGKVTINVRQTDVRQILRENNSGDHPTERQLSTALRAAGGVRPDANIGKIEIVRNGQVYYSDLRGVILGFPTKHFQLLEGDMIRVNSIGTPQLELITPSEITPPGIRVYISNLTRPAFDNASSAVGKHSTSLPYGSRFLTSIVSGNCAGGTVSTNSDRIAVLITKDLLTQQPIAVERNIEQLLRAPNRLDLNPFLLPDDMIVCYDSRVTNIRDIAKSVGEVLFPATLLINGVSL